MKRFYFCYMLFVILAFVSTNAIAAVYVSKSESKSFSVCFVANALTSRPDRVNQVLNYIKEFEHAANIKFNFLGACPSPTIQPNGDDYYEGDIRIVLPGTNVNATIPVPGIGCTGPIETFKSDPECISRGVNIIDCFARGVNGNNDGLWQKWGQPNAGYNGYAIEWSPWASLDGTLTSGAGVASWEPDRVDVFVRGEDNAIWHKWWGISSGWSQWGSLGGSFTSDPDAVSWGPNRIDVFVRGEDDAIWHKWWGSSGWSQWESLGGSFTSGPTVASWGHNRLDVFARGMDGAIWHKWWGGSGWSQWGSLGGSFTSDPDAVSWGPNRIDVFARGEDNAIWHKWWGGSGWSQWESLGGFLTSGPTVASWGSDRLDVFARGGDNALWHMFWNGSNWIGWQSLGNNGGWGSWSSGPKELEEKRACFYNMKLGDNGDSGGTPWRNHTLHEFGHALGLGHEHERYDVSEACKNSGEGYGGEWSDGLLTPFDKNSVMNYGPSSSASCGIIGNYAHTGLSDWDRLGLHILYPEDDRIAEFVGTTVVRTTDTLKLESAWRVRGANMSFVAKNFVWKLSGTTVSTGSFLNKKLSNAGNYVLKFTHRDFWGRTYSYTGPIRVLNPETYNKQIAAPIAAQLPLLQ